ncbi:uncharacterized protein L201_005199 [Kwoniella dendrophila CBS 6074]|uniref:FAD dependent oxidoreductase domain-containing protein n=1 Tax=Kwoniella dendrophila CBS 6074 TaxID=1295534 RepID=A0AAX4JXR8_9TREE
MSGFLEPHSPSTVSHWIATNRGSETLHNHGKDDKLPEKADIVIVGAGISGALLAYHLTHPQNDEVSIKKGSRIVILEGAEVSSSATGRNGGHFAPATFLSFPKLTSSLEDGGAGLTDSQATEILLHEWDNFERNKNLIKKHDLIDKVDLWEGKIMTIYDTKEKLNKAYELYERWLKCLKEKGLQDYSDNTFCKDPDEAVKVSRVKNAFGYSTRSAGSVHPHRLVTEILKICLSSTDFNVSLYTSTPVLDISSFDGSQENTIKTNRGTIKAEKVVLCTNAHTPHLFPKEHPLKESIFPLRIQMGLITPTLDYSGVKGLKTNYGFPLAYCANTPNGIVLGAGASDYIRAGIGKPEDYINNSNDRELLPECTKYLKSFMTNTMVDWNENAEGEGLMRTWTGVTANTFDRLPLIGEIPNRKNLFISAGFNGHGMSTTHTCNRALARLIGSESWDQDFPEAYIISENRLKRKLVEGGHYRYVTGNKL